MMKRAVRPLRRITRATMSRSSGSNRGWASLSLARAAASRRASSSPGRPPPSSPSTAMAMDSRMSRMLMRLRRLRRATWLQISTSTEKQMAA